MRTLKKSADTLETFKSSAYKTQSSMNKFKPFKLLSSSRVDTCQSNSPKKVRGSRHRNQLFEDSFNELEAQDDALEVKAKMLSLQSEDCQDVFNNLYKKLDVVLEKKKVYQSSRSSLFTSILAKSDAESLLPRNLGILRSRTQKVLDASNYRMGDQYAKVLVEGVRSNPDTFDTLNLKNNNLTYKTNDQLLTLIPGRLKTINLEGNSLGINSQEFLKQLNTRHGQLQYLNLENNKFNDTNAKFLFSQLHENPKIIKLNLSRNLITDKSMMELNLLLQKNNTLIELYLHWNRIHALGANMLITGLTMNQNLKVLDLSFNSIGYGREDSRVADFLGSKACSLIHLDISNNQFSEQQSQLISNALKFNHHLYGIHYLGNTNTQIDHHGFLNLNIQPQQDVQVQQFQQDLPGALNYRRINGIQQSTRARDTNEICWICDGWVEHTFYWAPNHLEMKRDPIYIHFSHERFAPVKMEEVEDNQERSPMSLKRNKKSKLWMIRRMLPSKQKVTYFFSSPSDRKTAFSGKDKHYPWPKSESSKKVLFYTINGNTLKLARPNQCNEIELDYEQIIDDFTQEANINCQPRLAEDNGILDIILPEDNSTMHTIEIEDFFKDAHRDSDDDYMQCFEFDWNRSQLSKILKEDVDQIKIYLKHIYRDVVAAYRHYSAYSPSGDIWCVPLNQYSEIFNCIVDKSYQLKDIDITFKQATSKYINETRVQTSNALIRFQFLEIIVRLALDKYKSMTNLEAIQKLYESDGLQKKLESVLESQSWRDQIFWSVECNQVILSNLSVLQQLFDICVSTRQLQYFTTKLFATPTSFKELFQKANLIDDQNAERNISIAFCLSIQLVTDEVNSDRGMQMNFQEFVEAIGRVSERIGTRKGATSSSDLAQKMLNLIGQLTAYYELQPIDEVKPPTQPDIKRQLQKKKSLFIQQNANMLVYEADNSPKGNGQIQ